LSVLDLSTLKNKEALLEKYYLKYVKDKYSRNIDLSDLKYFS
jgi:hypothetical protein